jgi:hypothetical protein
MNQSKGLLMIRGDERIYINWSRSVYSVIIQLLLKRKSRLADLRHEPWHIMHTSSPPMK